MPLGISGRCVTDYRNYISTKIVFYKIRTIYELRKIVTFLDFGQIAIFVFQLKILKLPIFLMCPN